VFAQEVHVADRSIPRNVKEALSPAFVAEWGPAMDRENSGFLKHSCFETMALPKHAKLLPGIWVFTRKRDGSAKARFCVGGHRQILGRDYFAHKN
jgi:aminoglycoside/choline kinase family phosphotransferase